MSSPPLSGLPDPKLPPKCPDDKVPHCPTPIPRPIPDPTPYPPEGEPVPV